MKQTKITLIGTLSYSATREFVLECSDDINPQLLDKNRLEELADESKIAWKIGQEGFVWCSEYSMDVELTEQGSLPIVSLPIRM